MSLKIPSISLASFLSVGLRKISSDARVGFVLGQISGYSPASNKSRFDLIFVFIKF